MKTMGYILYVQMHSSSYMYVANDHLHFGTTENGELSYGELLLSLGISPVSPYVQREPTRPGVTNTNGMLVTHDTHTHMQKLLHVCMVYSVMILIAITTTAALVEWWNYSDIIPCNLL